MKRKIAGYAVIYSAAWENGEPGDTTWPQSFDNDTRAPVNALGCGGGTKTGIALFATRAAAREAIRRTKHFRLAHWGASDDDSQWMRIVPVYHAEETPNA